MAAKNLFTKGLATRALSSIFNRSLRSQTSPATSNFCNSIDSGLLNGDRRESIGVRTMSTSTSFGSGLEAIVKETVSVNAVVVYSKSYCSYSNEVKSLFMKLEADPLVIELDDLGDEGGLQLQKVLERITGQHTVPNVFIGGKHIGGCTDILNLHQSGKLAPLLNEAKSKEEEEEKEP